MGENGQKCIDGNTEFLKYTNGNSGQNLPTSKLNQFLKRTYGSVDVEYDEKRLIYTWFNLDVFGGQNESRSLYQKIKSVDNIFLKHRNVPVPRKHLLKSVSGVAYPGEILAIMGSSGAGKTTLLNALAFRSPKGVQISAASVRMLNGSPVNAKSMQTHCAYVQQDDLFIGSLTAREHLIFQSMVRMPRGISRQQRLSCVDQVLQDLSLTKCQHTIIGLTGRVKGLSGGERKRLAFASEALTDPALLICDEPTSGLDSFMAHSVIQVLKNLSKRGKTVLLTIHQPSSELFALFDKILLIAEGRVAYLGTANQAVEFFSCIGAQCPTNYNPADFYIQALAIIPGNEMESKTRIARICDSFTASKIYEDLKKYIHQTTCTSNEETTDEKYYPRFKSTWLMQLRAILWRSSITVFKEPLLVKVRLIQTTMVAVLIGFIFYGQQLTEIGVMNINGAIFLFLTNMTFQNVFATITVFTSELPVFLREARSRLYQCDAYFLGKTLAELPLFLFVPLIFTSIAYPLIGLRPGLTHFLTALALVALVANVSTSFGYLISCACTSTSMALSIGPPVIIPFLLFGGFFLNSGSIPTYFKWMSYLSWFRYANEGLLINQWADVQPGEIECTSLNETCPSSGKIILETLNFSVDNFRYDFIGLAVLIVSLRLCAYFVLQFRTKRRE